MSGFVLFCLCPVCARVFVLVTARGLCWSLVSVYVAFGLCWSLVSVCVAFGLCLHCTRTRPLSFCVLYRHFAISRAVLFAVQLHCGLQMAALAAITRGDQSGAVLVCSSGCSGGAQVHCAIARTRPGGPHVALRTSNGGFHCQVERKSKRSWACFVLFRS